MSIRIDHLVAYVDGRFVCSPRCPRDDCAKQNAIWNGEDEGSE